MSNVVPFPARVNAEALSELERRSRAHFMAAINTAVTATFEETKRLDLGEATLETTIGIMRRAFDSVRLHHGW